MNLLLSDIVFEFETPDRKRIFDNLNVEFLPGQLNCLVGANGIGKSTLLNLITGRLGVTTGRQRCYFGRITADMQELDGLSVRDRAQYMMKMDQDVLNLLVLHFRVSEHLVLAELVGRGSSLLQSVEKKSTRDKILKTLEAFGLNELEEHWNKRVFQLNGGLQQTLALGMLAVRSPRIALLDEPTANLDEENSVKCFETLKQIAQKNGITVVIVSHDIALVAKFATTVFVLRRGKITARMESPPALDPKKIIAEMGLFGS